MANNNPNMFDIATGGLFTDYPATEDVEDGVSFAHDQEGTLEVETTVGATYKLPLTWKIRKNGKIKIGVRAI